MSVTGDCCIPSAGTFPSKESTTPFWRTEPHALDTHRSTSELPKSCDVLIVGGGYAGISTAYHILCDRKLRKKSDDLSIVLLEARQACSGATARNGGHLRPSVYGRLPNYIEKFGVDAAVEVADFEFDHVQALATLVEQEQIDCDFTITKSFSVYVNREEAAAAKEAYIRLKEAGIARTTLNDLEWTDEDRAEQVSGVKGCVGCFEFTAAHLWPYKLMMGLLQRAVESGLNLQTQTPATKIVKSTTEPKKWIISTPRGEIITSKIIFATNGYTAGLLPEYASKIVPSKGICCRIVYPADAPRLPLTKTYGLWLPNGSGDYLIPRNDNSLIVGGARSDFFHDLSTWHNRTDDDSLIEPARNYFDNYMQKHFIGWENSSAKVDSIWSGIMGYNSDSLPSVGPIPDREGCFIEAGFEGHGMPVIWLVARGIAEMITTGKKYEEVRIPRIYRTTKERLQSNVDDIIRCHKLASHREAKTHMTDDLDPDSIKPENKTTNENKGPFVKIYEVQCLGEALG
ncbi:BgtA-20692 [Blumeria graminis f. sp. tritici]|uniref:BgtA-20692 n=2 Tax=Blumeria graminis f. sp. tritici TaxID=62690 RepID=A0A9X9QCW6_BLUGR|nr:hypothetical protein BGT96224_A20692 [Blumeria graminis f. sp. tritici 96224]VDB86400.1 BgtA-20692 [Blumeria graminis f. sp. tritici]